MFIAQNGFEVLINILECNNDKCMVNKILHTFLYYPFIHLIPFITATFQIESLNIIYKMSENYGIQCSLCNLDVVKPLVSILLFEKNVTVKSIAAAILQNISKLRKGRKLIRLNNGIRILVRAKNILNILISPTNYIMHAF
jgi:hypothetical protein